MFLTISVTTFNRKKLSEFCIKTIHERTPRKEHELIVVDNGSTDGTVKMLEEYRRKGYIDKLILNHFNSLGMAINDAWKASSRKANWLIALANDHFCMEGWFENFKQVVRSEFKPDYILAVYRMPAFTHWTPRKTENGGSYLVRKKRWKFGYPFGGGLAIKKACVQAYDFRYNEMKFGSQRGSITAVFCRRVHAKGLRCMALGKPCILAQDGEFNNPAFKDYYETRFGTNIKGKDHERRKRKLALLQKRGYMPNPDLYYEGVDYDITPQTRKALEAYKKNLR